MPDVYDWGFIVLMLAYVVLRIGPPISHAFWRLVEVPAPPPTPSSRDIVRPRATQPYYPFWAQRRGQIGWVVVDVRINEHGEYLDHEVVAEAPPGVFAKPVAQALKTTTYRSHSGFHLPPRLKVLYKFVVPARDGSVPAWAVTAPGMIVHRRRGLLD
jgi:hypothetical protein